MTSLCLKQVQNRFLFITALFSFMPTFVYCQPQSNQVTENPWIAVAFMLSILAMKITAFILGYLIVKLGHDTFIRGITGEIDFGFKGTGFSTKLKSGSPGALFVLAGAAIIAWALFVEKPFETGRTVPAAITQQPHSEPLQKSENPDLPTLKR